MKRIIIFLLNFICASLVCSAALKPLRHGLAVCDARNGQWDSACSRMMNLLAQDYDDPKILYDAGVAAYRTGQFEQASAYFQDCCGSNAACKELKERAFFNKGNAEVEQKKLEEALKAYEDALELNADNEAARHNRDRVKEMLERQKQQQKDDQKKGDSQDRQQQDNDQKNNDNASDQKDSKCNENDNKKKNSNEKQENNNQGESDQEKGGNKEQSDAQDRGDDNQSSGQKDQRKGAQHDDQSQNKNDAKDQSDNKGRDDDGKKDDDVSPSGDERDSAGDQNAQQKGAERATGGKPDGKQQSEEKSGEQEKSPQLGASEKEQKDENLEKNDRALAAAQGRDDDLFGKQQAWMAQLLQEQENADKETNKKLVKTTVASAMVDNNGSNSW